MLQQPFTHTPTIIEIAQQIVFLCLGIVEKGFTKRRGPGDKFNGSRFNPGLIHLQHQKANSVALLNT